MDINDIRIIIIVISLSVFVAIVAWAWSNRQREHFREAANLPFADSDELSQTANTGERQRAPISQGVRS